MLKIADEVGESNGEKCKTTITEQWKKERILYRKKD